MKKRISQEGRDCGAAQQEGSPGNGGSLLPQAQALPGILLDSREILFGEEFVAGIKD